MKYCKILVSLCFATFFSAANATPVTCGSVEREASLDSSTQCVIGVGNPMVSDINAGFTSVTGWSNQGELTSNGTDQYLSANLISGMWGGSPIDGTWTIDDSFWDLFGQAVISMHVGNGGGDPDYFAWLIEEGQTMGTWEYEVLSGNGGGLSNLKLWGADEADNTEVPIPPMILLLGLSLAGLIVSKKSLT